MRFFHLDESGETGNPYLLGFDYMMACVHSQPIQVTGNSSTWWPTCEYNAGGRRMQWLVMTCFGRGPILLWWISKILSSANARASIGQSSTTAKANACKANVDVINSQMELYHATEGSWPGTMILLDTDYFPDAVPACPFSMPYLGTPVMHRVLEHGH
jgi:hypothetical protein